MAGTAERGRTTTAAPRRAGHAPQRARSRARAHAAVIRRGSATTRATPPQRATADTRYQAARRDSHTPLLLRLPLVGGPAARVDRELRDWRDHGHVGGISERDPEYVERALRWLAPICDFWFRGEVRHLDRIPRTGPVLMVANHSGGLMTPDTWVFEVNYIRHFGTTRPTYALAHDMVMGAPVIGHYLRASGALPADHSYAEEALLHRDAAVLVYPGGDEDVFRSWRDRNRIHLAGRTGFVRLALRTGVPIVPLVSVGGHETVLVLNDGGRLARFFGLDRRFRLKTLPILIGPPWGISPGDWLFHLPLPAKVTVDCGLPIDLRAHFGDVDPEDRDAVWRCYRYVEHRMQAMLDHLAAERRLPILG